MNKKISILAASALVTLSLAVLPSAARAADPACVTANFVTTCQGVTSDTAPYVMMVPANFNGTMLIYSHGYRPPINIPLGIPVYGGYVVNHTPEPGPSATVVQNLLTKGFGLTGSGFSQEGWNTDSGVKTDVELIGLFKKQFPTTIKVAAWGSSLGSFITQSLAEQHPELVSAAALLCTVVSTVEAELTMAGDALWGLKTFFDPSIKGHAYSAGAAGYGEAMGDLVKVFTVIGKLQGSISSGVWPDSSGPAGVALGAIPPRSALLLLGLMAGLPTQSAHFDSTSGPGPKNSPSYTSFALAASPALAILENIANAAALGVLAIYDVELQSGGPVIDNSKTDYSARVTDGAVTFNAALSGNTAIAGMLAFLNPANPAAPRWTSDPAAVVKMRALASHTGHIGVPTVALGAVADPITPAGNVQWLADRWTAQYAAEKAAAFKAYKVDRIYVAPKKNFQAIWSITPDSYTTFKNTGAPDTSVPAAPGTNHCNYSTAQVMAVATILTTATQTGALTSGGHLTTLVRKAKGLSIDKFYRAPLLKFFNEGL
jgi:pimeloyl-ACP methyl ester carboxylesterase